MYGEDNYVEETCKYCGNTYKVIITESTDMRNGRTKTNYSGYCGCRLSGLVSALPRICFNCVYYSKNKKQCINPKKIKEVQEKANALGLPIIEIQHIKANYDDSTCKEHVFSKNYFEELVPKNE